jgi:hypothetical protein
METKSIYYWLAKILILFSLANCESIRHQRQKPTSPQEITLQEVETPEQPVMAPAHKPEFMQKSSPRLGVVLGSGGALAYAHIGVLQELESQKIPIHSIAGLEWGALVAASYAHEGKAHGVEWKLLRFPFDVFAKKSFFGKGAKAAQTKEINSFLTSVFTKPRTDSAQLPFRCAYADLKLGRTAISKPSDFKDQMHQCLPYPPHFELNQFAAQPMALDLLVQALKKQGAEVILYVDVISGNSMPAFEDKSVQLLWTQNKALTMGKDLEVLTIKVAGQDMGSFSAARSLIRAGQVKSNNFVKELGRKYAY